ncbi:unnamed protein product [Rotaria magnacalcarata]|uniref:Protein kinase domain-containing protein n=6 Tax=Rotaria magnacalcarata TaxID=392030 RepID=A0A815K632_9BILA|nr:unnamed protein product [Rotaria magnacalcarata]CAF2058559.1 unnamed protein product [Rotaria magnacalcarata]
MNLVSKPTENQFNSRGQDVLPLTFKLFPQRSESVDNGNRTPPSNNTLQRNLSQPDIVNSIDTETLNFKPIPTSPFRLFGSTTSVSSNNSNTLKKLSTTDKVRRKRTPKIDDNIDGQKVKRRKSDMNMNQPKLPEPATPNLLLPSMDKKITPDTNKTISSYRDIGFSPASSAQSDSCSNSNHTSESSTLSIPNAKQTQTDITGTINSTTDELEAKNSQIQNLIRERDELRRQLTDVKKDYDKQQNILQKCLAVNKKLLVEKSTLERKQARQKCMENRLRLGQFVTQRQGATFVENWTDGTAFADISKQQEMIQRAREELDRERRNLVRRRPNCEVKEKAPKTPNSKSRTKDRTGAFVLQDESSNDGMKTTNDANKALLISEWNESEEILRLRLASLKKEEMDLQIEYEKLERERNLHIRELKRIYNEDHSRFQDHPVLNDRYLLLSLIGKGGFSEVHKAFCLKEQRYVAVKVHQLNKEWKEEKKANYIKHALRECDILKTLDHPRIVRLYDVFEIDTDSFCTVLEYIEGNDIDFFLKQHKYIPEKEARSVVMQTVSALRYLNNGIKPPVIHFDLKPANILLGTGTSSGEIKITDFGLSKQMCEDTYDPEHGMDLTSQGAGTYWYLPPEVFVQGPNPPKISSKVDVWSLGCIFFQCLYGRKPYGHNQSQAAILENQTILKAKEVEFPPKPIISDGAKAFIRRCLTYNVRDRPDVNQLSDDDYLRSYPKRAATNAQARTAQLLMNDGSN